MEQVADIMRESLDANSGARFPTLFLIDDACSTISHLLAELARLARGDPVSHEPWCILLLCAIDICVDGFHHPNHVEPWCVRVRAASAPLPSTTSPRPRPSPARPALPRPSPLAPRPSPPLARPAPRLPARPAPPHPH